MIFSGNRYEGLFKTNGNKPPYLEKFGKMFSVNGDFYIGIFKDGKLNGNGKIIYNDGDIYKGEFHDNVLNGHGKIKLRNATATIKGNFYNGLLQGKGSNNIYIYIYIYNKPRYV